MSSEARETGPRFLPGVRWLCALTLLLGPGCGGGGGGGGATTPTPTGRAPAATGGGRFGVDGFTLKHLAKINELGDGASGVNGIVWGDIEPNPPVGARNGYTDQSEAISAAQTARSMGRQLQVNVRLDSDWALEAGSAVRIDPGTGRASARWLRIRPEHLDDWGDFIEFMVGAVPVDYLQIGSEAENAWESASGFAEAVCVAATAARSVDPEIQILAAGFNMAEYLLVDDGIRAQILATATPEQLQRWFEFDQRMQEKMAFISEFVAASQGCFDVLTLHLSHVPEASAPTVGWVREQMAARGYSRPVWSEDMASGPFYSELFSTNEELALWERVEAGDSAALAQYAREQARSAVIKPVLAFAAGVERVFLSTDTDWPAYRLPLWRHQGLLSVDGGTKAAFFSYQQLVRQLDGFASVGQLDATTFAFSFADKDPVVVLWTEGPDRLVDVTDVLPVTSVRVETAVTEVGPNLQPVRTPDQVVSASSVPVGRSPVFATSAE